MITPARLSPTQARTARAAARMKHLLGTLFGLLIFSAGALLVPLLGYLPGLGRSDRQASRQLANRLRLAGLAKFLLAYFRITGLMQAPSIQGLHRLRGGNQLIAATHPTLVDGLFLIALLPTANCVTKSALWRNPITAAPLRALGYIRNDSEDLVAQCAASLEKGQPLIIFPEGTRSVPGQELKLLRGCAHIAVSAGVDITPVVIHCQPRVFGKGEGWLTMPPRSPEFRIDIFPDIVIAPYLTSGQPRSKVARRLTRDIEEFLGRHYNSTA